MKPVALDGRLRACGRLVREGAILLDVGSDHALLPITLVREGQILSAIATDLNEGPIRRAARNIAAAGLQEQVKAIRRDGLQGSESDDPRATDIVIAGMGGELIAGILAGCEWIRDPAVRLVLQPMTRHWVLRRFLWEQGYAIEAERLVNRGKSAFYQVFAAHYDPENRGLPLTPAEAAYGRENLERLDMFTLELLQAERKRLRRVVAAREKMQRELTEEERADEALLSEIEDYLRR